MDPETVAAIDAVIQQRATLKVFADPASPLPGDCDRAVMEQLVDLASWAPFHRKAEDKRVPWRFHLLDAPACRSLAGELVRQGNDSKIPQMLAAATALVLTTWRPDGDNAPIPKLAFEPSLKNMEHIAAAGAAIQNLLLAATARGFHSYWSSGGVLAEKSGLRLLGIPKGEIPLGAVFLFPSDLSGTTGSKPGDLREQRGPREEWARWVDFGGA